MDTSIIPKMKRNLLLMTIVSITNKRSFMTFLMIYLLMLPDATAKTAGFFVMIGNIVGFIAEVPSGYLSDKIGHKKALVLAKIALLLSTLAFLVGSRAYVFFIGSAFFSIGKAFASGTDSAFLHETLKSLGKDNQYAKIVGKMKSVGFFVPIAFILALSWIAEINFRYAFLVALLIDVAGLLVVSMLTEPPKSVQVDEVDLLNFPAALKIFWQLPWVRYILFGGIGYAIFFSFTVAFKQPYQHEIGISLSVLGILWAISRLFISAILPANGWIHDKFSFKQFTVLRSLIFATSFILIGLTSNKWIVAALFIFGNIFTWGVVPAYTQYLLAYIPNSNLKATMLSISEFTVSIFNTFIALGAGYLVFFTDTKTGFLLAGAVILVTVVFASILIPKQYNVKKESVLTH